MDEDKVVLTDEEGNEHEFFVVDVLELKGNEYVILLPAEAGDEEEDEAIILKVGVDENGEEVYFDIEDDAEWEAVAKAWEEMMEEEEEDEEEE
jgi:uncharacterized protein YrzB (UPF0473 family)